MQVKRCHFPGFTAKNAGGLMWFSINKNKKKKELQRLQRPYIVLGWPCECHLNRFLNSRSLNFHCSGVTNVYTQIQCNKYVT